MRMMMVHNDVVKYLTGMEGVDDPRAYVVKNLLPKFLATNKDVWQVTVDDHIQLFFSQCCEHHPIFICASQTQLESLQDEFFEPLGGAQSDHSGIDELGIDELEPDESQGPVYLSPFVGLA